jgi:hypothetical protein
VADAVGGEDDEIRTSDKPREKGRALGGVVVQKFAPDPGCRPPQRLGLAGPTPYVEHRARDRRIAPDRNSILFVFMTDYRLHDGNLTPKSVYFYLEMQHPPPVGIDIGFQRSTTVFGGADAILLDGEAPAKIGNQTFRLVCGRGRLFDFPDGPGYQQIL